VGGVLYISYNTLPGWAAFAPMRHLMTEHSEIIGPKVPALSPALTGPLHRKWGQIYFLNSEQILKY
jgi:hypothetical protein